MRLDRHIRRATLGFTLPELLVALALIIFIMSILSSAFASASKVVSDLRAANDLAERLRGVMTLLRRDLAAQHLDNPTRRLSDNSWVPSNSSNKGFSRIYQPGTPQLYTPPGLNAAVTPLHFPSPPQSVNYPGGVTGPPTTW